MLAIHERFAAQAKPGAPGQAMKTITVEPAMTTVWRRKHEIKVGFAPHLYTGAMQPAEPPAGTVRVGYSDRVDDPEAGYEYVGFAYRAMLSFAGLPVLPQAQVKEARLVLHVDETVWQLGDHRLEAGYSTASQLLILDAAPVAGQEAFYTPAYLYTALPQQPGKWGKGEFTAEGELVIDMTAVVQDWMSGRVPNCGVMVIGPDELFEHDNNRQESLYSGVRLIVHYSEA